MTNRRLSRLTWAVGLASVFLPGTAVVTPSLLPRADAAFPGRNGRIAINALAPPFDALPEEYHNQNLASNRDLFTISASGS